MVKGNDSVNRLDYDKTLISLKDMAFEELTEVVALTEDHFLKGKIKKFLTALETSKDAKDVKEKQEELLGYLEHALGLKKEKEYKNIEEELGAFLDF